MKRNPRQFFRLIKNSGLFDMRPESPPLMKEILQSLMQMPQRGGFEKELLNYIETPRMTCPDTIEMSMEDMLELLRVPR